ncbi:hypothetical protein, variant [Saprolegnia diclina VS20]|uniref:Palmitoyltransferase n=1 Tax=Saprolegnia diclina (strain VS20) TaxID=1156394 RepID=T0RR61_SAPDV|nr:hypothetical protein, variant [Saprolegnia diclina VS20]EQC32552.1 hypothetical protein, variant [Saprolegnia diclina VS20]|eukprot:XP_008614053.1 hypothetical protein, variant [Saprolegnia diclina VS20]
MRSTPVAASAEPARPSRSRVPSTAACATTASPASITTAVDTEHTYGTFATLILLVWVNTCIAQHNYNAFFFFLVVNVCGSSHLVYLLCSVFIDKMTHSLADARNASVALLTQVLTDIILSPENARVAFVASLALAVWFLVSLLLGCQMGRVYRNCTANEHFKRQRLHKDHADDVPAPTRPVAFDMSWGGVGLVDASSAETSLLLTADDIDRNPYDGGVLHNVCDAFNITRKDKTD